MTEQHSTSISKLTMDDDPASTQKISKLKKRLKVTMCLALFFLLAVVALAIGIAVIETFPSPSELEASTPSPLPIGNELKMCTTPGCAKAAGNLLEAMDDTVDPCEDFYMFSCGNWLKKNIIPEDKSQYSPVLSTC
ncbi:MME [Bugula neritina]|uniref:MME n=1 Tax=Bugula neritina TaxID=10212 RepID=A0A7J7KA81_BUGNE|nr:MME [Bugula neritina]